MHSNLFTFTLWFWCIKTHRILPYMPHQDLGVIFCGERDGEIEAVGLVLARLCILENYRSGSEQLNVQPHGF